MKILAVMEDLFFAVKIHDAAKGMGAEFEMVTEGALEKVAGLPDLVVLDLNYRKADPVGLILRIKANPETAGVRLVGFVSHVNVELRAGAVAAGCDRVVARSTFAEKLKEILEGGGNRE